MKIAFLLVAFASIVIADISPCDDIRYNNLKNKMEYQLNAEEKMYLQEYTKRCVEYQEDQKKKKEHHPGRVILIVLGIILTVGVINKAVN